MPFPVSNWRQPAAIVLPGAIDASAVATLPRTGSLAAMVRLVVESYPPALRRQAQIICGDSVLGREAIAHAYRDMPLT